MEISRIVTRTCHGFPRTSSLHPSDLVTSCSSPPGDDCHTQTCFCEGYLKTTLSIALLCSSYDLCRFSGLSPHCSESSVLPMAAPTVLPLLLLGTLLWRGDTHRCSQVCRRYNILLLLRLCTEGPGDFQDCFDAEEFMGRCHSAWTTLIMVSNPNDHPDCPS